VTGYLSAAVALIAFALVIRIKLLSTTMFTSKRNEQDLDGLEIELSKRIFGAEDSGFVSRELDSGSVRHFRRARTILALEWLRNIRLHVNFLFRSHLRASRNNPDLSPRDEIRLTVDFVGFQLATSLLYAVIFMFGPLYVARLVSLSLKLGNKLQLATGSILPRLGVSASAQAPRS
jgi:hypothetical protein